MNLRHWMAKSLSSCLVVYILLSTLFVLPTSTDFGGNRPEGPVFVYEPPSSVVFSNSSGASVSCTAHGIPAPILDWIREDGTPVQEVDDILHILPNNTLHFPPFPANRFSKEVHTAKYRCTAQNSAGKINSRLVHVTAVLADQLKINTILAHVYVMRGGTAVFRCTIYPTFIRSYIRVVGWTKGDKSIKTGDRISILPNGELHVRDVSDMDGAAPGGYATYRCVTRNILTGEERTSKFAYLHVHGTPAGGSDPLSMKSSDKTEKIEIRERERGELPCVADGYPFPSYSWTKDGKAVTVDGIRISQKGGNLIINRSQVSDSGLYNCTAANDHGQVTAFTQVTVEAALSASLQPESQIVDAGKPALFNCSIFGNPVKLVKWYKNGDLLQTNSRVVVQSDSLLRITEVGKPDEGMYQCEVSNEKESAQGTAQLLLGAAKPSLLGTFDGVRLQPGGFLSVKCVASGNPTPEITWSRDGEIIRGDGRLSLSHDDVTRDGNVVSFVNVTNIRVQDGGEYQCAATNTIGEITHSAKVEVFGGPYIRPMRNVTATASHSSVIRCYVSGFPIKSVTWLRDGSILPINHRQQVKNGELTIDNVQRHDEGKYTCTASNGQGQTDSTSVFVSVMEPPMIDPFRFPKRKQGDRVVVSCVVSTGDLPINITWVKDGHSIRQGDSGIYIQKTGTYSSQLSISDADPSHDGNYTCYATNDAASSNFTASFQVDVPPRWVVEPQDSFVVLGNSVIIDCQTDGKPDPVEQWKKAMGKKPGNYRPLTYDQLIGGGVKRAEKFSNGSLLIRQAKAQDHGYYLCHASNQIGAGLSKVIFLNVHIPAHFEHENLNYTMKKGSNFTLVCNALGDKPLSVAWKFDTKEIDLTNRRLKMSVHNTEQGKLSSLNISPVVRTDSGFYVCSTKNNFGNGVLEIQVIVIEPPDAPFDIRLEKTGSKSISLSWKNPYDGNSEITNYIIQYKNTTDIWKASMANLSVSAVDLSATISKLHPFFSYSVRVMANNSVGLSEPSATLIIKTDEEAPTGPPINVTAEAIGSQTLNISWQPPALWFRNGRTTGYLIGIKEFNASTPYKEITRKVDDNFKMIYIANQLKKFTKYVVHIEAFNSRGTGPKSEDVEVLTLEDVPSQPPQNVAAQPSSSQSIKVVWSPPPLYTLHGILKGYKVLYKPVRLDEDESDAHFEISAGLEATIQNLQKYTNYSIQVLAFTRMGEGVRCSPIYVKTKQDLPGKPADVKALPASKTSIVIAWLPPVQKNGILTKYIVHYRKLGVRHIDTFFKVNVAANKTSYAISGLHTQYEYAFGVTASTIAGEGEKTREVTADPHDRVAARIASFPTMMIIPWQHSVILPCDNVGDSPLQITWNVRGRIVAKSSRIRQAPNGSLLIDGVRANDAANYTCRAENRFGADEVVISLRVKVRADVDTVPNPPALTLAATTSSTVQVNWLSGSNGGSRIKGFILNYRRQHSDWLKVRLGPKDRTYTAINLLCGTPYTFYVEAHNIIGTSQKSEVITTRTNGTTPIMPPQNELLAHTNVTFIDLDLTTWQTGGCAINYFAVKYQIYGDDHWVQISNHIESSIEVYRVFDLHPETWYIMTVVAHSDAGSTESELTFGTLTYSGSTIQPRYIVHQKQQPFYESIRIMVPLSMGIVFVSVCAVILALYCRRRKERKQYKVDHSSNLRRDLTVETSLMNDLDKRNVDLDAFDDTPDSVNKRNVNLLVSLQSDESIHDNSQSWLIHDASKTTSDNSVTSRSDEESNLHPYASYNLANELVEVFSNTNPVQINPNQTGTNNGQQQQQKQHVSEEDLVALEKEQAHRAMVIESPEAYGQIIFPKKNDDYVQMPLMPPFPTRLPPLTEGEPLPPKPLSDGKEGYENPSSIVLSPRGTGSHGRHSALSSVTTVSSSRDELLQAYENAKILAQPPSSGSPLPYEALPSSGNSQATDNSGATEPGIRKFTQSPPQPNEQREAACEIPVYEQRRRHEVDDGESDTTECEWRVTQPRSPPRRSRGKRGKKGHVSGKRQLSQQTYSRAPSRTSTTSSTSEEVTYTFGGRSSPNRCTSPSEGYLSYPHDSHVFTDSDFDAVANHPTVVKKKARRSPRSPPQYDILLPTTPGAAADETKPLTAAVIQPGVASPHHMEEETSVSLLDRYYRTVPPEIDAQSKTGERDEDKGYSDDYTVV